QLGQLRESMVRVVNDPGGTARGSKMKGWVMAGKTGTSQNPHGDDHALFVGFAPAEAPEVLAAVVVEFGQSGSRTAAPLVSRILQGYLDRHHPEGPPPPPAPAATRPAPPTPATEGERTLPSGGAP
ncbi:MAG: penicillin-binding transpeptidase domain-containing protein, partial [Gemmatimonadota bacterium]